MRRASSPDRSLELAPSERNRVIRPRHHQVLQRLVVMDGCLRTFEESLADDAPVQSHSTTNRIDISVWGIYCRGTRSTRSRNSCGSGVHNLKIGGNPTDGGFSRTIAASSRICTRVAGNPVSAKIPPAEATGVDHNAAGTETLSGNIQYDRS